MVFERLFDRTQKLSTLRFEFDPDFEANCIVSVIEDGNIPEAFRVWIFDLYYAKILYIFRNNITSERLKSSLEDWAEHVFAGIGFPIEAAEEMGLLILDKNMQLTNKPLNSQDMYLLEVFQKGSDWPYIQLPPPIKGYQNRLAYSIIVLLQHFINQDKIIVRELAIHILMMRKYYNEIRPLSDMRSTIEAPAFAVKESADFFNGLLKEFDQIEREGESEATGMESKTGKCTRCGFLGDLEYDSDFKQYSCKNCGWVVEKRR